VSLTVGAVVAMQRSTHSTNAVLLLLVPGSRTVPQQCYVCGMSRVRVSTTVDEQLLAEARARSGSSDSALIDEALRAFLARNRNAEIDAAYVAYDDHPIDEPDEWGDLSSFRDAAAAT
jgi:Bacterial antitoxin of type II TA system, VapB